MKQEIDFVKFNPTQNMTILVTTNVPQEAYSHVASKMMSYNSVYAEQVGFIHKPSQLQAAASLQMAGDEFCGNACMSLAAYIASNTVLQPNEFVDIVIESSGIDRLVQCQVKKTQDEYNCRVAMPIPEQIEQKTITYEGDDIEIAIIQYTHFIHIVIEVDQFNNKAKTTAKTMANLLGVTLGECVVGILLYRSISSELMPLIYVPALESMIWERGCGSGTASIGAYLAWKQRRNVNEVVKQPGGVMRVNANFDNGEVTDLTIEGSVGIVAKGKAFIEI